MQFPSRNRSGSVLNRRWKGTIKEFEKEHPPSLLICLLEEGAFHLAHALLQNPSVNINVQDFLGQTPLIFAVAQGREDIVAKLLARPDVRVNLADGLGRSAIFYAAQAGFEGIVGMFLESRWKVDLSIRDSGGRTALDYAQQEGHD
ncbi:hypothetical protein AJ79_01643 [Helicocarpus griseus UAMH5409]|uniref:Uncharacterized protein n=1 Tax=Helicocarpus griseus UAMH5409 TaxID=1447875 RepID=A0A2B7Y6M8_9EURO|nr:hypothetical protein AJ79_01643 [Helicocarpus griseus UAMH5409]